MGVPLSRTRVSSYSRPATDIERSFFGVLIARLAARRVELGMTQEALDQELGVSDGQVGKWEAFLRLPGAFMLVCWAHALGITLQAVANDCEQ